MSCNLTAQLQSSCHLSAPLTIGQHTDESNCVWTCDDLEYYCQRQVRFDQLINATYPVTHNLQYQIYHAGCVCNLLLFLVLLSPTLTGVTFMFLRVMAFVQLCLGALYYFHPGPEPDTRHNWAYNMIWPSIMRDLLVSGRFMLHMLAVFMTLDRFMAIATPIMYSRLNARKFFLISVIVSFLISLIQIAAVFRRKFVPVFEQRDEAPRFYVQKDPVGNYIYISYVAYIVIGIKVFSLASMIFLGLGVTCKLWIRGRQVSGMMSSDSAVKEYKIMRDLCRFQAVDTLVAVIDILVAIFVDLQLVVDAPGNRRGSVCSLSDNVYMLNMYLAGWILDVTKDQFLALEHGELFLIYLVFFRKFRMAALDVVKTALRCCKCCGLKQVTPESVIKISHVNVRQSHQ